MKPVGALAPTFTPINCVLQRSSPVFTSNCRGQQQFDPFRASSGNNPCTLKVRQPLHVVASRHHRERKIRARLANRANHFATHLLNRRKRVLNPRANLRDVVVTPLLCFRQRAIGFTFALNPVAVTVGLEPLLPLRRWVTTVGINISTGIGTVHDRFEMLAVMPASRVRYDPADELVVAVDIEPPRVLRRQQIPRE